MYFIDHWFLYDNGLRKKNKKENEKVANRKLGNLGNLGNIIPSFLISKFSILPYSQNRKLGITNLGKKIPSFPSFRPGRKFGVLCFHVASVLSFVVLPYY